MGIMTTLTITTKGQITLRKDLLKHLGVHPGDKIVLEPLPDGRIEARAEKSTGSISAVFGALKQKGRKPLSISEMNEIAAQGWSRRK